MTSEDETFRRLKRSTFEEVLAAVNALTPKEFGKSFGPVVESHGWTMDEYGFEGVRRGAFGYRGTPEQQMADMTWVRTQL